MTDTLMQNRDNSRKFWRDVKSFLNLGKTNSAASCNVIKDENGNTLMGQAAIDYMNSHYVASGENLAKVFGDLNHTDLNQDKKHNNIFSFRFITEKELIATIKRFSQYKPSGIDNLNMTLLKDAMLHMSLEVTYLINRSLDSQIFPRKWAVGDITPIPKEGSKLNPSNWRPISILPFPSKIIERLVHSQITYYLESTGLLHGNQHGFRKNFSTNTATFKLLKDVYSAIDSRQTTSCIFVDYRKAFDTIDHSILLSKFTYFGFDDTVLNWCKSYLAHRKQCVKVGAFVSKSQYIKYGVPQGSILGPLLFLLYVNDLHEIQISNKVNILMYADDTVIYTSDENPY